VLTRPLTLGADLVLHSATKYLNGHSDVVAGAIVFGRTGPALESAARLRTLLGGVLGPFEASLLLRGLRTLHVRVRHQCASAMTIARHFPRHLGSFACSIPPPPTRHAIAARQMTGGFGACRRCIAGAIAATPPPRMKLWKRHPLGGVESLVEHRSSIEGAGSLCPLDLLRFSVGLEDVGDLIADIERALRAA
jgi:cystathionine gamma-synthase